MSLAPACAEPCWDQWLQNSGCNDTRLELCTCYALKNTTYDTQKNSFITCIEGDCSSNAAEEEFSIIRETCDDSGLVSLGLPVTVASAPIVSSSITVKTTVSVQTLLTTITSSSNGVVVGTLTQTKLSTSSSRTTSTGTTAAPQSTGTTTTSTSSSSSSSSSSKLGTGAWIGIGVGIAVLIALFSFFSERRRRQARYRDHTNQNLYIPTSVPQRQNPGQGFHPDVYGQKVPQNPPPTIAYSSHRLPTQHHDPEMSSYQPPYQPPQNPPEPIPTQPSIPSPTPAPSPYQYTHNTAEATDVHPSQIYSELPADSIRHLGRSELR